MGRGTFPKTKTFPNPKLPQAGRNAIATMEFEIVADCVRTASNPVTPCQNAASSQFGSNGTMKTTYFSKEREYDYNIRYPSGNR